MNQVSRRFLVSGTLSAENKSGSMERKPTLKLVFTEDEAYELLLRCVSSGEDDNAAFRTALKKLADAIKQRRPAA